MRLGRTKTIQMTNKSRAISNKNSEMSSNVAEKSNPSAKKKVTFVHNQYNSPIGLYSTEQIAETINRHAQVLTNGRTHGWVIWQLIPKIISSINSNTKAISTCT